MARANLQVRAPWTGASPIPDARPVGCERTASTRRTPRSQHLRQPRPEADAVPCPHGTRIPCERFQARASSRRQDVRHPSPAAMVMGQAHRPPHRTQGHRVQRTAGPPPLGHRAHDVVADRLPTSQPPPRARTCRTPPRCMAGWSQGRWAGSPASGCRTGCSGPWPLDWQRHCRVLADLVDADGSLPEIQLGLL